MLKWYIESTDVGNSYVYIDEYDKWQIFFPLSLQDISEIAEFSDLQKEYHHKRKHYYYVQWNRVGGKSVHERWFTKKSSARIFIKKLKLTLK